MRRMSISELLEIKYMELFLTAAAIFMAGLAFTIRMKAAKKPLSIKKIILPPLFMSTGFLMFLLPEVRVDPLFAIEAFIFGIIIAYPLIATSKFELKDGQVYMKRSKAFILIILALFLFRWFIKVRIGDHLTYLETSGLFYLLAFGMIITWRITMLVQFNRFKKQIALQVE